MAGSQPDQHVQTTTPLGVYSLGRDPIVFAQGLKAGDFVFLNGVLPRQINNMAPHSLLDAPAPLDEAGSVWDTAANLLEQAGSSLDHMLRCDQYFTDWRGVPFFHQMRRERCGVSPPSTSLLVDGLVGDGFMMMDVLATGPDHPPLDRVFPDSLDIPATSGFAPVIKAGDWVFVAGFMAAHGKGDLGGIAPEAKVPEGHLWKGNRIQLETGYLIEHKLVPALQAAGMSLSDVCKATVALSDLDDLPAFNDVWRRTFSGEPPVTSVIPISNPGFAIADARVEINLVAHAGPHNRVPYAGHHAGALAPNYPIATQVGDFLLFSAMVAPNSPREASSVFHSAVEDQMAWLLDTMAEQCERQGTSLRNVVRIAQHHTDLRDVVPSCRAWQRRLPDVALPFSAFKVPRLAHPSAVVQVEIWVYCPAPGGGQ